jgi:hypothetical protein
MRKYLSRSTVHLVFDSGACVIRKEGKNNWKGDSSRKISQEEIYGTCLSIFLSLYPKNSAIASGATPIGSAVAHPVEKSRQKEGEKSKLMIKSQLMDT